MRRAALALLLLAAHPAAAQEATESLELVGQIGSRSALLLLYATREADGAFRVTGEYVLLPTLARRYLEGERSPQLRVTTLKEGTSPILFGRPATATLRGTWRGGVFKGMRFGPGGQERERFEFSEAFPSMEGYSAAVRCEAGDARYASSLAYAIESGKLKSFEWRSALAPAGHACSVAALEQRPFQGGLKFESGRCAVTLRDLGDFVRVAAENCEATCGSQGYLEPLLIDRRGGCRLFRPRTR